jgi:aspartyl-tRNA synthetase
MKVHYYDAGVFRKDPSQMVFPEWCSGRFKRWTVNNALRAIPRDKFDYVWMVDVPAYNPALVEGLTPIWRGKGSMLYRIDK